MTHVGIIGAGTMGCGIAQCLAASGRQVVVVDPEAAALASGPDRLRQGVRAARLLRRGAGAAAEEILSRVRWRGRIEDLDGAGFVIECAPERSAVKREVFRALDAHCPPETVLASCTSAIPIGWLAAHTGRPDRVLGLHFMNPAPLTAAVEVVRAAGTGDDALRLAHELLDDIGKRGIVVGDGPGFVSNRLLMMLVNEAAAMLGAGTADAATVDRIFQDCFGHPMGPLRTADLIGLDTVRDTLLVLVEHTGDGRFTPCAPLTRLVEEGRLGRKSGGGFHDYPTRGIRDAGRR